MLENTAAPPPNRIPISIMTGFLGSGKTTVINHLVKQPGMSSTALIINEFGEIGLDNLLIESAIENTLILENGCICCSIRGDLVDTICDLFAKVENRKIPNFTRILIETTGLADPAPIVQSLQNEDAVSLRCTLDYVVTMVDGVLGAEQIKQFDEAVSQIAQADIVLLTKSDLCDRTALPRLTEKISQINPTVTITQVEFGIIDPEMLFRSANASMKITPAHHHHDHDASPGDYRHGNIVTCSLVHNSPLDETRLRNWLAMIYSLRPYAMLRLKGVVWLRNSDQPLLIQAVGGIVSPLKWLNEWRGEKSESQLVLIFKGMSPEAVKKSFHRHVLS